MVCTTGVGKVCRMCILWVLNDRSLSYARCEPVILALGRQMQTSIVEFEASLVYIGQPGLHSENLSQKQTKQLVSWVRRGHTPVCGPGSWELVSRDQIRSSSLASATKQV